MRNPGLDLLRLLAVLLVMGHHLHLSADYNQGWLKDALGYLIRGGWIGVDLFFVLSGYLVSGLLFSEYRKYKQVRPAHFLIRRGFKIYPAFWVFILITVLIRLSSGVPVTWSEVGGELLFVQNYWTSLWGHTWSLAIEEHFYIGLALIVGWLCRKNGVQRLHWLPWLFVGMAILCFCFRLLAWQIYDGYSSFTHLHQTHQRVDSLFAGVTLSYLVYFHDFNTRLQRLPTWFLLLAGCALLTPPFLWGVPDVKWLVTIGPTLYYLGGILLVIAACRFQAAPHGVVKVLCSLGAASYSIYLYQELINSWGMGFISASLGIHSPWFYGFGYLVVSMVVGYGMSKLVEMPFLYLRDKWFPSRSNKSILPATGSAASLPMPAATLEPGAKA
jgi:peptidoglycan/LPS O-acetylase OafA/YrhL